MADVQLKPVQEIEPLLLDAADTARLLCISRASLYCLHNGGRLPAPIRLGRSVRWSLTELRAWVNAGCPGRNKWEAVKE